MSVTRRECLAGGAALLLAGCGAPKPGEPAAQELPPPAVREFRGAWVATVANIDWPSAPGLPAAEQQAQALRILDRAAALGLNALVLQVRPAADAIYPSALEPWSEYLGGAQGMAMAYDPLAFWVEQAHQRGLELHAWFNPFRARHPSALSPLAANHVANTQPGWVKAYGEQLWLDPGQAQAQQHTLAVVADVAARYDIDGVHIDDYFYPYPIANAAGQAGELPFPDEPSWQRAQAAGTTLTRDDWRRANVDVFVRALYERVHAVKAWLRVGVSPFGLPRGGRRPSGIEGFDAYAKIYADAERWLAQGWLDYAAPQLYWPRSPQAQAFAVLLDYWGRENVRGRHLWPGLFTSAVARPPRDWPADEVLAQLALLRAPLSPAGGHIHFSMAALIDDRDGLAARLQAAYPTPALVPATPWLGTVAPPAPALVRVGDSVRIEAALAAPSVEPARWFVLWQRRRGAWRMALRPAHEPLLLPLQHADDGALAALAASSVGRSGAQSQRAWLRLMADD